MRTILTILMISILTHSYAQEDIPNKTLKYKNSVQLEGFGAGFAYTLNYERIVLTRTNINTAIQGGIALCGKSHYRTTVLRADLTEIIGARNLKFELGVGITNLYENPYWTTLLTLRIGIRYQKSDGRFLFRVAFTPFYGGTDDTVGFFPWGGLSVGYAF